MTATVIGLQGFKARAQIVATVHGNERVWNRLERLCGELTSGGITNTFERNRVWHNAAEAFKQYIDNEWPIEKENKCRADMMAEYGAILYVQGIFNPPTSDVALTVQEALLEAFDENIFQAPKRKYGEMVQRLVDAAMTVQPAIDTFE